MSNIKPKTEHAICPKFFDYLLNRKFVNKFYEITFAKNTPNCLTVTFCHRETDETFTCDVGLQKDEKGNIIVTLLNYKLYFQVLGLDNYVPFREKIVASPAEFIRILNYNLINVTDDEGIAKENNKRYLNINYIDDFDDEQKK